MRTLPAHVHALGLEIVSTQSYGLAEIGPASFFASSLASYPTLLPVSGIADAETVQCWVDIQMDNSANGTFFGSINFYTYLLRLHNESTVMMDQRGHSRTRSYGSV